MSFGSVASTPFLMMLRIASLTWTAAAYPARVSHLVPLNAARVDAINSGGGLVRAVAAAAAGYSPNQFDKILEEVALGIRALHAASSQLDGDAGATVFDLALSQDLNDLLGAPEGSASVAQLELWPGGAPPGMDGAKMGPRSQCSSRLAVALSSDGDTAAVGGIEPWNARSLMPPQRSVILDAELCEHTRCEPIGVPLAGHGKLNNPLPDQHCRAISQADRELKLGAHETRSGVRHG